MGLVGRGVSRIDLVEQAAKAGLVDIGYVKATGSSIQMVLPKTGFMPEMELEWKIPEKSNAIERDRAEIFVPRWYRAAAIAQALLPGAFRRIPARRANR